jgi:hypothetical protein
VSAAANFAEMRITGADDPPVLLAGRARDVLASGHPGPDLFAWDTGIPTEDGCMFQDGWGDGLSRDEPPTEWMDSYRRLGSFTVASGFAVNGLRLLSIPSNIPWHPDVFRDRELRLAEPGPWRPAPLPDKAKLADDLVIAAPEDVPPPCWMRLQSGDEVGNTAPSPAVRMG